MPDENLLLYLNLTGELFYIICHRMNSQKVKADLQAKVHNDLALTICNLEVINSFKTGRLRIIHYTLPQMRTLLGHIVHSSIMSLNDYSLEKLFELTLIATKYQFAVCQHPKDILLIALNHLDSIRKCLTVPETIQIGESVHHILVESYGVETTRRMKEYLQALRHYVQGVNLKMTNLVSRNLQKQDGSFVINNTNAQPHPGCTKFDLRHHNCADSLFECVDPENEDIPYRPTSTLELNGDREISLGLSLYYAVDNVDNERTTSFGPETNSGSDADLEENTEQPRRKYSDVDYDYHDLDPSSSSASTSNNKKAIQGLDLFSTLLGCGLSSSTPVLSNNKLPNMMDLSLDSNSPLIPQKSEVVQKVSAKSRNSYGDLNVVRFDARYNRSDGKAALSAIAKDFDSDTSCQNQEDGSENGTASNSNAIIIE